MGGSLVRSLLLVTESGINVYEHHAGPSQLTSSQLISGMYTAFFTFFEAEMSKGPVHSIELSKTKIIVFNHFDLNCIIEYERYCGEYSISVLTEKSKELLNEVITEQSLNPNRYIKAIEQSDLSKIFTPSWQKKVLHNANVFNLLDIANIWLKDGMNYTEIHNSSSQKIDPKSLSSRKLYHTQLSIDKDLDYLIVSFTRNKSKVLANIRILTDFLTIIKPTSPLTLPYFLPYHQEIEKEEDYLHLLLIYGWVLPELLETLLIKRKLHVVGTDKSTENLNILLESVGIHGFFKVSPFYQSEQAIDFDAYDIIRSATSSASKFPIVDLYNNEVTNLIKHSILRDHVADIKSPEELLQALQEFFHQLDEIHHDLFDILFQNNPDLSAQRISEYKKGIDKFTWLLALQFFLLKTPFLTQQLYNAVEGSHSTYPKSSSFNSILSSNQSFFQGDTAFEVLVRFIMINGLTILILLGLVYLIFALFGV